MMRRRRMSEHPKYLNSLIARPRTTLAAMRITRICLKTASLMQAWTMRMPTIATPTLHRLPSGLNLPRKS
ncbi:hypothetical protein GGF45_002250, partial [Coemansia sp. RSA 551]